jgi:ATP-binding cassette, subfamily B, bacterial PglK
VNLPLFELNRLSFHYEAKSPPTLESVNLIIPKGARVGFIGATGSGKTTLMDVVTGLLEPPSGRVLVDDVPIADSVARSCW